MVHGICWGMDTEQISTYSTLVWQTQAKNAQKLSLCAKRLRTSGAAWATWPRPHSTSTTTRLWFRWAAAVQVTFPVLATKESTGRLKSSLSVTRASQLAQVRKDELEWVNWPKNLVHPLIPSKIVWRTTPKNCRWKFKGLALQDLAWSWVVKTP